MDTFVDSSWYFLRYISPRYDDGPFDPSKVGDWNPVDQYTGGAEHAVMHLLYARFFTKIVRDLGLINFGEPFLRLFNQGTVLSDHMKMSKSRGNVIAPDEYVQTLGADVVRLYLMFMGPWEGGGDWSDSGINGVARWVNRLWDLCSKPAEELPMAESARRPGRPPQDSSDHQERCRGLRTLQVQHGPRRDDGADQRDGPRLRRPGACRRASGARRSPTYSCSLLRWPPTSARSFGSAPATPYSIHQQSMPEWDEVLAAVDEATLVVQVNGKVRDRIAVPASISEGDAKEAALTSERVRVYTDGKQVDKIVFVPGRYLVSVVVKG